MVASLVTTLVLLAAPAPDSDPGPFVRALWLVQRYGTASTVVPANDQRVKGQLWKALGKDGELTLPELDGLMESETFTKIAGPDDRLAPDEIARAFDDVVPESRRGLLSSVRENANALTTAFDMIDDAHRLASTKLAEWIAGHYRPGQTLDVIMVCTGNSGTSGGMAAGEFSKTFGDPANPQQDFAALMVCGEADAACPFVKGSNARI